VAPGEVLMGETSRAPVIRAWDPTGPWPACGPSNGSSIDERRGQSSALHDQRVGARAVSSAPGGRSGVRLTSRATQHRDYP